MAIKLSDKAQQYLSLKAYAWMDDAPAISKVYSIILESAEMIDTGLDWDISWIAGIIKDAPADFKKKIGEMLSAEYDRQAQVLVGMRPEQIEIGRQVNYYSWIDKGEKSSPIRAIITSEGWQLADGRWVCNISELKGCVAISHLEPIE